MDISAIPQRRRVAHLRYHLITVWQSAYRAPDRSRKHGPASGTGRRSGAFLLASGKELGNI